MTPTDQRLREIAERENKATKGPWDPESGLCSKCDGWHLEGPEDVGGTGILIQLGGGTDQLSDLSFIARSRQDVPWLLALIKKQREALEADALADKLFERAEAHREESIACGYDNDPTGSLAVTESYKAANAQALIATQLKRDALNFSPENL